MTSILDEIFLLQKNKSLVIDHKNSNRYRVVTMEPDGSRTAYYFTVPIYNNWTRKVVDMRFHAKENIFYLSGSNANVTIAKSIRIENAEGSCIISLTNSCKRISDYELLCDNERIYPTTNGIAIRSACQNQKAYTFTIEVNKPFLDIRANDKCFALMIEKFRPFLAVSCIGTEDSDGNIVSPAKIEYQKKTDNKYTISITPCSPLAKSTLIEINLYEPKLFQDTTVESNHPKMNNAFGGVGFIGTTKEFGEQWLYTRLDYSKITELNDKKILRAVLHVPKLNNGYINMSASRLTARFCSFGSTWDNKIDGSTEIVDAQIADQYINLNLMPMISDIYGRLYKGEGFILKAKNKNVGFSVIPTGDNYLTPQILEINYI